MKKTIKFNYQKSPSYLNHHVDGAFGGINPKGSISIHFYNERAVIPKVVENEFTKDGKIGKIVSIEKKEGIVREIETAITIDIGAAISIRNWLDKTIKDHAKIGKHE